MYNYCINSNIYVINLFNNNYIFYLYVFICNQTQKFQLSEKISIQFKFQLGEYIW